MESDAATCETADTQIVLVCANAHEALVFSKLFFTVLASHTRASPAISSNPPSRCTRSAQNTRSAMPEAPRPLPTPDPPQHTAFPPLNSSTHGVPHCAVAGRFAIMLSLATAALALAGGVVEEVKPSNGMVRGGKITEC